MGMDVYGKSPTSEIGRYFRNSVWWWRPLADYCIKVAPDICAGCTSWHSNDGDGLSAYATLALANTLQHELDGGRCSAYAYEHNSRNDALPDEQCKFCEGTGIRRDPIAVVAHQHERLIDDPGHPRHGERGWCNGCDGTGTVRPWSSHYPFSVENVAAFVAFLYDCGGFEIC